MPCYAVATTHCAAIRAPHPPLRLRIPDRASLDSTYTQSPPQRNCGVQSSPRTGSTTIPCDPALLAAVQGYRSFTRGRHDVQPFRRNPLLRVTFVRSIRVATRRPHELSLTRTRAKSLCWSVFLVPQAIHPVLRFRVLVCSRLVCGEPSQLATSSRVLYQFWFCCLSCMLWFHEMQSCLALVQALNALALLRTRRKITINWTAMILRLSKFCNGASTSKLCVA